MSLPVHGFVLAGGRSTRMGTDKALLPFCGVPLVQIAVGKLRSFCAAVSIVGERHDLERFAPIVRGERTGFGPGAGVEAGLQACEQPWAMFTPVDVPRVPAELLQRFASHTLAREVEGVGASFLLVGHERQPGFAMVRRGCLPQISQALDAETRRLDELWLGVDTNSGDDWVWMPSAESLATDDAENVTGNVRGWFANLNTPEDLAVTEDEDADSLRE